MWRQGGVARARLRRDGCRRGRGRRGRRGGADGADGADGSDGSDGTDGTDGSDGTAPTGCSGGTGLSADDAFFETDSGASFWVLYPSHLADCAPVLVFLHPSTSVGLYDMGLWRSPLPTAIDIKTNEWGYTLLVPFLEPEGDSEHTWSFDQTAVLEDMVETYASVADIDLDRVAVMGQSAGAFMATHWALSDSPTLDAAFSVAGGLCNGVAYPDPAPSRALPFWVSHDPADEVVPFACSEDLVSALEAGGHEVVFDRREDLGHFWTPELTDQMLEHWLGERGGEGSGPG